MEVSRQEYWSGLPCPPPGHLPDPGIKLASPVTPSLQADSSLLSHRGSPGLGEELGSFSGKPGKGVSSPDRDWKEGKAEVGR